MFKKIILFLLFSGICISHASAQFLTDPSSYPGYSPAKDAALDVLAKFEAVSPTDDGNNPVVDPVAYNIAKQALIDLNNNNYYYTDNNGIHGPYGLAEPIIMPNGSLTYSGWGQLVPNNPTYVFGTLVNICSLIPTCAPFQTYINATGVDGETNPELKFGNFFWTFAANEIINDRYNNPPPVGKVSVRKLTEENIVIDDNSVPNARHRVSLAGGLALNVYFDDSGPLPISLSDLVGLMPEVSVTPQEHADSNWTWEKVLEILAGNVIVLAPSDVIAHYYTDMWNAGLIIGGPALAPEYAMFQQYRLTPQQFAERAKDPTLLPNHEVVLNNGAKMYFEMGYQDYVDINTGAPIQVPTLVSAYVTNNNNLAIVDGNDNEDGVAANAMINRLLAINPSMKFVLFHGVTGATALNNVPSNQILFSSDGVRYSRFHMRPDMYTFSPIFLAPAPINGHVMATDGDEILLPGTRLVYDPSL